MKEIKILGPGCAKCQEMFEQTQRAVDEMELDCRVEKVTDIQGIMSHGVMFTPALVVDGEVKVSGRVPSFDDLKQLIK